jgi:diguanylate cyclase (GGDEF)-like protein
VSLRSKMLTMAVIPVAVLVAAAFFAMSAQREAARTNAEVDRTNAVGQALDEIQDDLSVAEGGVRGFLLTSREGFQEDYQEAIVALRSDLVELTPLVDDPLQRKRLERLQELTQERVATLKAVERLAGARTPVEQRRLDTWLLHDQTISDALRGLTEQMEVTAAEVTAERVAVRDATFERSFLVQVLALPGVTLVAMFLMITFTAGIVRRVGLIRNNARRLEQGTPLQEPDASRDELGSLSRALVRTGTHVAELQEELRHLATVDQLTGLANRRGFFAMAGHQLLVAARTRSAVALLFIDTDGLKHVNDRLGHSVGDALLVEAAEIIGETIRVSDLAGRLGGDEFCVLLIGDPDLDAERVVQRMRDTEAAHNTQPGRQYRVSLSIGVSALPPGRSVTLEELMDAADERMYQDKRDRNGRVQAAQA